MAVTMRDVAQRAGVSAKTVSNVVNGYEHVSEATRARVQAALDELGYEMNVAARHLRSGRTGLVALALPELSQPYFAELAEEVVRCADERGLTVLVEQTGGTDPGRERLVLGGTRRHLVDGLLFSPLALSPDEVALARPGFPVVLLGERVRPGALDHVGIDNVPAARAATAHLLALGHRRIAALGRVPGQELGTASLRLDGFRQAMRAARLPVAARDVLATSNWHRDEGAEAATRLLRRPGPLPDAVFCLNDTLALGALRTLLRAGVRVPQDIAVIGFDDLEEARYSSPSLSSVAPGRREIARLSVDLLQHRMRTGFSQDGPVELFASYRVVERESTLGVEATGLLPVATPATDVRSTSRAR